MVGSNLTILDQIVRCQARRAVPLIYLNGHNSIIRMFFSRFNDINLFLSIVSESSVPPGVGPQGGLGQRRPPWSSARSQNDNGHKNINNENIF